MFFLMNLGRLKIRSSTQRFGLYAEWLWCKRPVWGGVAQAAGAWRTVGRVVDG